ncbi:sugar ABC transporter permease [Tessaracoccus sp. OS52]|uniref:carbohydrate ABC transporter permease n=1 Tax=Tessaracoccus sp. OS52 TaxID=2886691 RepID=UPI001D10448A|nr:sugar ABC transporter permease [Tessaracoccus sp. OS52]MCC2593693.1 sugar ABC transporter permease [Tessaracoccus sp. OS52]
MIIPSAQTIWISLHQWSGAGPMDFVGLGNYRRIFGDPIFLTSFKNTLAILFVVGGVTFAISFVLMLVLRDLPGRRFIRAVIFFPNIVPGVVLSIVWGFLFQHEGLVNTFLRGMGVDAPPEWLNENNLFMVIMMGLIWINTGFFATILLAAVDRIPPYLFEDASLAGANAWQRMRHIIFPLTWDVIGVAAILWTISSIKIFEFIYAFAGGAGYLPPTKVWNTAVYTYAEAFSAQGTPRYGTSAATAIVMLLLVGAMVALVGRIFRHDSIEY